MSSALPRKVERLLDESQEEMETEAAGRRDAPLRSPDTVPDLEEYEGAVVGMHISEGPGGDPGLPGAFGKRRDSSRLADLMLRMQTRFLDEIGLRERQADEGGEQQQAPTDQGKGKLSGRGGGCGS
eukprot:g18557.t1